MRVADCGGANEVGSKGRRMKHSMAAIAAVTIAGIATGASGQTGDAERTRQQEALGHAVAIQTAWRSVEERIRVTDAANLWEDEWDGLSAPPSGSGLWWLSSWTERGLTARYCDGVLAVYATRDELKGVQRDHREVQVAPALYGGGRTGLHIILAGTRIAVGAHGRDDETLPNCMAVPSTTGDRVGLVSAVADPIRTVTGFRWEAETRDVLCAGSPADTIREARRMAIQLTSVRGAGEARGWDLAVTAPGNPYIWPSDCGLRVGLGPEAQCTPWKRIGGGCPHVFAQAAPPTAIPDPIIEWHPAPVYATTAACACSSGQTGTCTLHYEQNTEYRDFYVRPGAARVRTRRPARVGGERRLVARREDCTPIVVDGGDPGGPGGGDPGGPGGGDPGGDGGPGSTGGNTGEGTTSATSDVPEQDTVSDPNFSGQSQNTDDSNNANGGGGAKPIVLDLDGDGVELVPLEDSTAFFDINGDGYRKRMAWASADDGFLAYDKDGDGAISDHDELSFVSYVENAETDLVGLKHFDTDGDGQLDADDAEWGMFRVWQDLDQDGESDPGELRSMDEAGIQSVSLTSDSVKRLVAGNTVYGEGIYVGPHGPRTFYDVVLRIGLREE